MKRNSCHYYVIASGKIIGEFMSFVMAAVFSEAYVQKSFVRDVDIYRGTRYVCSYKLN